MTAEKTEDTEPLINADARGWLRVDRERDRKRKGDFWGGLEGMSSGVALMVDWEGIFGSAVDVIRPFLEVTGERSETFPCPAVSPCGCRHSIRVTRRGELIAECRCEWGCGTYQIEPADILFHGINTERLGRAIRRALGFAEASAVAYESGGLREIGTHSAAAAPVYFSMEGTSGLLRQLTKLLALRDGPFLVVTPTGGSWSAEVEALARPHSGGHVALASVLAQCKVQSEECRMGMERTPTAFPFRANGMLERMLAEFARRVASLRDAGGTLRSIHREIAAVRCDFVELRNAKQRLEKMLADGLFAFTRKADATSFKVLCCVLGEGDVAKASRTLGMPDATVRTIIRRWRGIGKEYRAMQDLVRWRKTVGRKGTVMLNDQVLLWGNEECRLPRGDCRCAGEGDGDDRGQLAGKGGGAGGNVKGNGGKRVRAFLAYNNSPMASIRDSRLPTGLTGPPFCGAPGSRYLYQ